MHYEKPDVILGKSRLAFYAPLRLLPKTMKALLYMQYLSKTSQIINLISRTAWLGCRTVLIAATARTGTLLGDTLQMTYFGSIRHDSEIIRLKMEHKLYMTSKPTPLGVQQTTPENSIHYFHRFTELWCTGTLLQQVKIGVPDLANFSKTAEQKQTPLILFVARLEIRIILKNEPNWCTLEVVIAKTRYRTKRPWRRGTSPPELKLNT